MAAAEPGPADLAQSLLGGALGVRRGESVIIETWNHSLPYAAACVVEARRRGAHPMLLLEDEAAYWRSVDLAPAVRRWSGVGAHEWAALAKANAYVFFPGPADAGRFAGLPEPTRTALTQYNHDWYRRARRARLRGVRCLLGYASDGRAAQWGVSAAAWRGQLLRGAVEPDLPALVRDARRTAERLRRGKVLRVTSANGTDLTLRLRGRRPYVDDGVVGPPDLAAGHNMTVSPPGTVTVAVDERSAEGMAIASRPSFVHRRRLEGGQWEVTGGHLVNHWYTDGQEAFDRAYAPPARGKEFVGSFSVGINPALAPGVPQVEDQELGAVTLALGDNTVYGGSNRSAFNSWIVVGEATVAVDGAPLVDRGKLLA